MPLPGRPPSRLKLFPAGNLLNNICRGRTAHAGLFPEIYLMAAIYIFLGFIRVLTATQQT